MSLVYFISHPNVEIDPETPIPEWPLSEVGIQRMTDMLNLSWVSDIQGVFCSTEQKAIDGASILARHLRLSFETHQALGENDRSSTGYLLPAEFESMADKFFAAPLQSVRGWESARDAQNRIVGAIERVIESTCAAHSIAVVSHGAVGTLLLCHLNGWPIDRKYDQPGEGGGNFFCFHKTTFEVIHGWRGIDTDTRLTIDTD